MPVGAALVAAIGALETELGDLASAPIGSDERVPAVARDHALGRPLLPRLEGPLTPVAAVLRAGHARRVTSGGAGSRSPRPRSA